VALEHPKMNQFCIFLAFITVINNKLQENLKIFKNIEIYNAPQPPSPRVRGYPIKIKMRPLKTQISVTKIDQQHTNYS
jgi:hypothetical protein